jgi:hypothetical protein
MRAATSFYWHDVTIDNPTLGAGNCKDNPRLVKDVVSQNTEGVDLNLFLLDAPAVTTRMTESSFPGYRDRDSSPEQILGLWSTL